MITQDDLDSMGYTQEEIQHNDHVGKTPLQMVQEYMKLSGQTATALLYRGLIHEEFEEWYSEIIKSEVNDENQLKELSDLVYVIFGYAATMGWNLDEAVRRVHENNVGRMKQPDGTIKRRNDGKIVKNKDFPKVDLKDLV